MRFSFEQLEPRQLLATVTWSGFVVNIEGTDLSDTIIVSAVDGELVFSGSDVRVPISPSMRIEAQLLGGDDSFTNDTDLGATVYGGEGDDSLIGGTVTDYLYGQAGTDFLDGRGGDDNLSAGGQTGDVSIGGEGFDDVVGITAALARGVLTVTGTAGDDLIRIVNLPDSYPARFRVDGLAGTWNWSDVGSVVVRLGGGDDVFLNETGRRADAYGEAGNDSLSSVAEGVLDGGDGVNLIHGSHLLNYVSWVGDSLSMQGTTGDDQIVIRKLAGKISVAGYPVAWNAITKLTFDGLAGKDRILNLSPVAATLKGGDGNDTIIDGAGSSTLLGNVGNDYLVGGAGNDTLDGGAGNDRMYGGLNSDFYTFGSALGNESDFVRENSLSNEQNLDRLDFSPVAANLTIQVSSARGLANDGERVLRVQGSTELIYGGSGNDSIHSSISSSARIVGGSGDDQLSGTGGVRLEGSDGNDILVADGGNNDLQGGNGDDRITALGLGKNVISGGNGNDILTGGLGDDILGGDAGDDQLFGLDGNDTLQGGYGVDRAEGGNGNDLLVSGFAYYSGSGLYFTSDTAISILLGGPGDDLLYGSAGQDSLSGGLGFDEIYGDKGNDKLLDGHRDDGDLLSSIEIFPGDY